MSKEINEDRSRLTLKIPIIKAESETQTLGHLVSKSPDTMETPDQKMSIRKRRNLSKNRGQAARQREKTPEPSRTPVPHEDTTTSDDEECLPRNSREIEADNTYEEMKRLVQEKANVKDPVYDIDIDEVLEQRAMAANERRRRSISPFALPDKEEMCKLQRKGSFIDPTNKLLSTSYNFSPKDEDLGRRNSLTIETPKERRSSLTPPTTLSPQDKNAGFSYPTTPKKLEKMVYPDEVKSAPTEDKTKALLTPETKEHVFTFEDKDQKILRKTEVSTTPAMPASSGEIVTRVVQLERTPSKKVTQESRPAVSKTPETPGTSGEIVTKIIQLERTPSKKLTLESKPDVQVIRERIVRTPSRKMSADIKPVLTKPLQPKQTEGSQPKLPPVKPARSKSASRMGRKTSESDMSEDQGQQTGARRKVVPTPRRFIKNRSPRANRSQSMNRVEDVKVIDRAGIEMSQTSKDIIDLMQKRARSLSIPKDDPKLLVEYKYRTLQTPNRSTPSTSRTSRGISCPKTIQIISDKQILSGLSINKREATEDEKQRKQSGYIDASQSEYTSSCYSSSPSENEFDFDLSERTAELTRKLKLLSQEVENRDFMNVVPNINLLNNNNETRNVLRKRTIEHKNGIRNAEERKAKSGSNEDKRKIISSRFTLIANWQQFIQEHKANYKELVFLRNKCICDLFLVVIMSGLGGMMFKSFEGSFENAYKCGTRNVKRDFIESLWRGSHHLREEDWKSMARKKLYEFEDQLHTAHEAGVTSYSGLRSWSFMNSFMYCLTLITTIGYGHIAPKTMYGRVATIVYAIIGIPLFLIVLADFGKLFTRIIKFFWAFIRRFYYTRSCRKVRKTAPMQEMMKGLNIVYDVVRRPSQIFSEEDLHTNPSAAEPPPIQRKASEVPPPLPPKPGQVIDMENDTEPATPAPSAFEIDDEFNLPISVAIFILIIYIVVGALVINIWEQWGFFESFYFVFISMSTIGLGDLVPNHPIFMMASILYLVFGLALTSMCINVVQEKLSDTFKKASAKLGATIGLQVAEEDGGLVPMPPSPTEVAPVHKSKSEREEGKEKTEETKTKETNSVDSKNK